MNLVIIDYGAGNTKSVQFALDRLGVHAVLSADPQVIQAADKVIFPGVGHAAAAMDTLKQSGVDKLIPSLKQPVLGICLGMQLMCERSEEGNTQGLGIFKGRVQAFDSGLKVPQIGWNAIRELKGPLFKDVAEASYIYMVHSYYAPLSPDTIAVCDYGTPYSAALAHNNFYGTQFHPEKSSGVGAQILKNFIDL
ncbi:MAG: imidazole glycerol phosphate synthase subunit HisH [Flavobacteriia bacterium]|nr:imidazole glycerol phosphate synthase subunit HisH [Flavobacteriia bacterium]